jgi:alcohol dehydrogenase class IV
MEQVLKELVAEVKELNKRIGANGYNAFIGAETSLISSMEEMSIKLKRLNQSISNNPITLDKHKLINKI